MQIQYKNANLPIPKTPYNNERTTDPTLLPLYGSGFDYFKIQLVNTILNILTSGLYYPWAKAKNLQYLYSKNTLEDTPFVFSGTGKEMFKGFIKAVLVLIVLYALSMLLIFSANPVIGILVLYGELLH